jgi:AcrR family transcriptional regulator
MKETSSEKSAGAAVRSPNRDKILDAAEIEFATHSYESCSLRMIAETSGVNLGLLHYYFGSKQALFAAVFLRRSATLTARRFELLAEAKRKAGGGPVPLEELIRCFITPTIEMIKEGEGPKAFIRLHSRLRTEPLDFARDLRRKAFNNVNFTFVDHFAETCPHLSRASVVWRFTAMVGAYLFLISQSGRVEDLSDGACDPADVDSAIAQAIPFIAAGFLAPDVKKRAPRTAKKATNGKTAAAG